MGVYVWTYDFHGTLTGVLVLKVHTLIRVIAGPSRGLGRDKSGFMEGFEINRWMRVL